jgi:poly(hydroxyalkanoate) granule-associated protein
MAKKTLKKKVRTKSDSNTLVAPVMESAREIWLAGLGAFAVAQEERGKIIEQGSRMFDRLVTEGAKLEKKTRQTAENAVDELRGEVDSALGSVRQQAVDNWDKLEKVFEERVARALGRLGVPTADEVRELSVRVQELTAKVAKASRKPAASKPAVKKPAVKKPVAKKPALKKPMLKKPLAPKAEKAEA